MKKRSSVTFRRNVKFAVNRSRFIHFDSPDRSEQDSNSSAPKEGVVGFVNHRPKVECTVASTNFATLQIVAQQNERKRIAQELHDTLLQGFTGIALKLDAMTNSLPPELSQAKQHLQKILEQTDEYLAEARRSIWKLRSNTLETTKDLAGALMKASER